MRSTSAFFGKLIMMRRREQLKALGDTVYVCYKFLCLDSKNASKWKLSKTSLRYHFFLLFLNKMKCFNKVWLTMCVYALPESGTGCKNTGQRLCPSVRNGAPWWPLIYKDPRSATGKTCYSLQTTKFTRTSQC